MPLASLALTAITIEQQGDKMISAKQLRRPLVRASAIAGAGALGSAGIALAARPLKDTTYSGSFKGQTSDAVSFKVSANGKKVSGFSIATPPVGCQGGEFGSATGGSGSISKQGTFKVTLSLVFAPAHRTNGKLVVSGKFGKKGAESGQVSSIFTNKVFTKSCNASIAYSTKG